MSILPALDRSAAPAVGRRRFLAAIAAGLLAAPLGAEAQRSGKVWRIGFLAPAPMPPNEPNLEAFRQGLRDLGYVEGQNLVIELRSANGHAERLPELAAELVGLHVDVLLAAGTPGIRAAKNATVSIPILMAGTLDPVRAGFVQSLARPGGNITGLSADVTAETWRKRLQLIIEAVPSTSRVALLWSEQTQKTSGFILQEVRDAASKLKVTVLSIEVRGPDDLANAYATMARERIGGILFVITSDLYGHIRQVAELALEHRLPVVSQFRDVVVAGALLSYGPSLSDLFRRAASYVAKILKGAKPGDLPVELPTKFELVINLKTSKALGLTIPPSVLARADEVLE